MHNSKFRSIFLTALASVFLCCYASSLCLAADQEKSGGEKSVAEGKASGLEHKKGIAWYPYEDGLLLAKAEDKKIFLHFYTSRCHYCKVMATKTFTDDPVIALLNENFVSVKVNLEDKPSLASIYHVPGVPMSWFLESSGDRIGARPGYLPPEQFMDMLRFVIADKYK